MPAGFTPWTIMIMAPGAFFMLGLFIWMVKTFYPETTEIKG
jgi:Na+-transporting NADH:ubiquinone oxidoreductase subunit D